MTTTAEPTTLEVGKARVRKEDARLITGRSRYTDAITPPGTLHMHVVRSPLAHAKITGIDTVGRQGRPGRHRRLHRQPTSASSRSACRARGRSPRT